MKSILKSLYQYSRNNKIKTLIFKALNKNWYMRGSIAKNSNVPVSILEFLYKDEDEYVHYYVAGNPNTPIDILEFLSKDKENIVRLCAIRNLNDKKSINKNSFLDYLKDLFYNLFKKKKKRE